MSTKYADIRLFYYKEGDDLATCIVRNDDGTMNVKESFQRHIGLLQASIDKLQSIHDTIPDDNTCKLDADTHHIGIYGDDNVVQALIDKDLASLDEFYNEEEPDTDNVNAESIEDEQNDEKSIEKSPKMGHDNLFHDTTWVTDWQKTCAEYEQWYIDAFNQNPKNRN